MDYRKMCTMKMRCEDCRHSSLAAGVRSCMRPVEWGGISPYPRHSCESERRNGGGCGPSARHYKSKAEVQ